MSYSAPLLRPDDGLPSFDEDMTLEEREKLITDVYTHYTAFSPRPDTSLENLKPPVTDSKISMNHRVRTFRNESSAIYPLSSYQTWIDVGKMDPLIPETPDPEYNSNVWRHFTGNDEEPQPRINNTIASMYPLSIPPPSRMGGFTYAKFIKNGDIFCNQERKRKKITWSEKEIAEMKKLRAMSDARVPPTDERGFILPPLEYRRLQAQGRIKHMPNYFDNRYKIESNREGRNQYNRRFSDTASLASRNTSLRHKGLLWKFSYKENNPAYSKTMETQRQKEVWLQNNARLRQARKQSLRTQLLTAH